MTEGGKIDYFTPENQMEGLILSRVLGVESRSGVLMNNWRGKNRQYTSPEYPFAGEQSMKLIERAVEGMPSSGVGADISGYEFDAGMKLSDDQKRSLVSLVTENNGAAVLSMNVVNGKKFFRL